MVTGRTSAREFGASQRFAIEMGVTEPNLLSGGVAHFDYERPQWAIGIVGPAFEAALGVEWLQWSADHLAFGSISRLWRLWRKRIATSF